MPRPDPPPPPAIDLPFRFCVRGIQTSGSLADVKRRSSRWRGNSRTKPGVLGFDHELDEVVDVERLSQHPMDTEREGRRSCESWEFSRE